MAVRHVDSVPKRLYAGATVASCISMISPHSVKHDSHRPHSPQADRPWRCLELLHVDDVASRIVTAVRTDPMREL